MKKCWKQPSVENHTIDPWYQKPSDWNCLDIKSSTFMLDQHLIDADLGAVAIRDGLSTLLKATTHLIQHIGISHGFWADNIVSRSIKLSLKPICIKYKVRWNTGGCLNIKILSYQYRNSHYTDKTVSFIFTMEIPIHGKTGSLYWDGGPDGFLLYNYFSNCLIGFYQFLCLKYKRHISQYIICK